MINYLMMVVIFVVTKSSITEAAIVVDRILLMTFQLSIISELFETNEALSRIHTMNSFLMIIVFITTTKLKIAVRAIYDDRVLLMFFQSTTISKLVIAPCTYCTTRFLVLMIL